MVRGWSSEAISATHHLYIFPLGEGMGICCSLLLQFHWIYREASGRAAFGIAQGENEV